MAQSPISCRLNDSCMASMRTCKIDRPGGIPTNLFPSQLRSTRVAQRLCTVVLVMFFLTGPFDDSFSADVVAEAHGDLLDRPESRQWRTLLVFRAWGSCVCHRGCFWISHFCAQAPVCLFVCHSATRLPICGVGFAASSQLSDLNWTVIFLEQCPLPVPASQLHSSHTAA